MTKLTIDLPWPARELWPNTHTHWSKKYPAQKQAKRDGELAARAALAGRKCYPTDGPILVRLTFYPPDKVRRDRDNLQAAMKHYLDGIAVALEIDDSLFAPYSVMGGLDPRRGSVIVEIGA